MHKSYESAIRQAAAQMGTNAEALLAVVESYLPKDPPKAHAKPVETLDGPKKDK